MKKVLYFLFTIMLVVVLAACGGDDDNNADNDTNNDNDSGQTTNQEDQAKNTDETDNAGNATNNTETEEPEEDTEESEEQQIAQVGDTINVEGVNITVTGVSRFEGRINQFEPLQEDHAIAIDVEVENTNKESYFIDSMEFTLYDPEGYELNQALPGDEEALSADLPGGKKAKGRIFFDIPANEGTYELHYESIASWEGSQAIWEIPYK